VGVRAANYFGLIIAIFSPKSRFLVQEAVTQVAHIHNHDLAGGYSFGTDSGGFHLSIQRAE
jgi:hypothetical protein